MKEQVQAAGTIAGIAHRPVDGEPMQEASQCAVEPKRGITTENRKHGKREVTLLAKQAWADVCRELGTDLPWYTRRANLLVDGLDLAETIGHTIAIGDVRVYVHGETGPCGIMDQQHPGLKAALKPDCRGGVHGQVLSAGTIQVGDPVSVVTP